MASADELRAKVAEGRAALRQAIEGAAGRWEQSPGGEEWAPRRIAEHAIGTERAFAGMIARGMQGRAPDRVEVAAASAADALAAMDAAGADFDRVARYVEDRDLEKATEVGGPFANSVQGAFDLSIYHLNDHAKQIAAGG